jgi:uncharacterized membrane protein YgdD (TMEM256/DUF423 family)
MLNRFMGLGAVLGFAGVAAGAFGAHGLASKISPEALAAYQTGVRYLVWHALALLAVGLAAERSASRWLAAAGWLYAVGCLLFSGSLALLATLEWRWLGPVTPVGGTAFLAGWVCLAAWAFSPGSSPRVHD